MRDAHLVVSGTACYVGDVDRSELISRVRKLYPKAMMEGSCGAWSFTVGDKIVAEAWLHRTKPGWRLRILPLT